MAALTSNKLFRLFLLEISADSNSSVFGLFSHKVAKIAVGSL